MAGDRPLPIPLLAGALVTVGGVLERADIDWVAIGSLALLDKPLSSHTDIDLCIVPEDANHALDVLQESQLPAFDHDGWIVKTYVGNVLIDLIYKPEGVSAREMIDSSTRALAIEMDLGFEGLRIDIPVADRSLVLLSQEAAGKR